MKVLVTATQVPFARGGAEAHMRSLVRALWDHGHQAELMRVPFTFAPEQTVRTSMDFCAGFDLDQLSGGAPERVISLQFPAWGMTHHNQVVWIMHQHRAVYELYDPANASSELAELRQAVHRYDHRALGSARRLFANSRRVARRLEQHNGLEAEPLYHPPPDADAFYSGDARNYILFPSRLETLKRQDLLVEAACHLPASLHIVLLGEGGQQARLEELIRKHGLEEKVHLLGHRPRREQLAWYAHALGVFFGPKDEDYGYVTLEAMLAARPVITCTDSGGPLEFVQPGETGEVVEPEPDAVAEAIHRLWRERERARRMGEAGRAAIKALDLNWNKVVERLLQ